MRLSHLSGKEVINLGDGARLGMINECELSFDGNTGRIHQILVPNRTTFFNFLNENRVRNISWQAIKRIGDEVIIVDLNHDEHPKKFHNERQLRTY